GAAIDHPKPRKNAQLHGSVASQHRVTGGVKQEVGAGNRWGPRDLVVHVDVLHKATVESLVEQLFGQHLRQAFEMDDVDCVADDVARMTAAETFVALDIVFLDELLGQARRALKVPRSTKPLKDLDELRRARASQKHLVLDAAQESFVTQLVRTQVGGENQECFERHGHFAARLET